MTKRIFNQSGANNTTAMSSMGVAHGMGRGVSIPSAPLGIGPTAHLPLSRVTFHIEPPTSICWIWDGFPDAACITKSWRVLHWSVFFASLVPRCERSAAGWNAFECALEPLAPP